MSSKPAPAPPRKSYRKKLLSLLISLALLALLIGSVDRDELLRVLAGAHARWLALALLLFIPQTLAIAHRWTLIARPLAPIALPEATRQVLASSCLNLVLPSKLGDLAKGVFLYRQGRCALPDGIQIVVFEKLLDLAALSAWMILGWLLAPDLSWWVLGTLALGLLVIAVVVLVYFTRATDQLILRLVPPSLRHHKLLGKLHRLLQSGPRVMALIHADPARRASIVAWSFLIWLLHLLQIACFFWTLGSAADLLQVLARMPIALFAGLLPISIAGFGVRDWALVTIFTAVAGDPRALLVGVGLLVGLRYIVPAAAGLPFLPRYLGAAREAQTALAAPSPQSRL